MTKRKNILLILAILCLALMTIPACDPSYPKEGLAEAVKDVCKTEYNMGVDVTLLGNTMGVYYPMEGLLDIGMGISKEAWDNVSDLLFVASRMVLSTDAEINFYCIIAQDVKFPELQVVLIKYVDDVKRSMVRNISRNESFKRTLLSVNLTPQAEKERSVHNVLNRLGVDEETRHKVLDEFFRSPPTKLSDIGYWKKEFYLKEITLEEFLAEQIANRIKMDFKGDKELSEAYKYMNAESVYVSQEEKGTFYIKFKILEQTADETTMEMNKRKVERILRIANEVVYGYKFKNFDLIIMEDQLENIKSVVKGEDLYDLHTKRTPIEDIVKTSAKYF